VSAQDHKFLYSLIENYCKEFYENEKKSILYLPNMIFSLALSKFLQKPELEDITKEDFENAVNFKISHIE
jgi:hypothetical protein